VDTSRFLVEVHLATGRPIGDLAKAHGVDRSWLYRLLARYRREGEAGLEARSRRPKTSPTRIADLYEDEIVRLRKELEDEGLDAGALSIHTQMERAGHHAPSVSTIHRVLRARGHVTAQPHKRPKSSYVRFCADLPNQLWQGDVTHFEPTEGLVFEILNMVDDHSRLCVASRAFVHTRSPDVVRTLHRAAFTWGYPHSFLSDNGAVFTASKVGGLGAMEAELLALGIVSSHSRPYHPQTCGKVERFHQTLKKFLAKQEPATSKKALQHQLDRFATIYNTGRGHGSLGRRTPLEVWEAKEKMGPRGPRIDTKGRRVRHDRVDKVGRVTLRHASKLHHILVGRAWAGWRVIMLVDGLDVEIIGVDGSPLKSLTLDPSKDYHGLS
jgi:transposase InsO family protein